MKFLKLEINNINSLEYAEIDFQNLLSKDEHFFLIWGPSGSGKTTILDAISLALFKRVPRLEEIPNKNAKYEDNELKFSESKGRSISTDDIYQYLKRGTKSGYCALEFLGNDNKKYIAKISFSVNKKNTLSDPKWTLESSNQILDNKKEVGERIKLLTGLTYEQFCRTTLLAQGEFTKFMKSDQKSKGDILEKLTDTGIFSEIGKKIFEKYSSAKKEYENLHQQNENVKRLSDDEISNYREELEIFQLETDNIKTELIKCREKISWINEKKQKEQDQKNAIDEMRMITSLMNDHSFIEKENIVKLWENTEPQRNIILKIRDYQDSIEESKEKLLTYQNDFYSLSAGLNYIASKISEIEKNEEKIEENYNLFSSRAEILNQNPYWTEKLSDYQQILEQLTNYSSDYEVIIKDNNENKKKIDVLHKDLEIKEKFLKSLESKKTILEKKIKNVDYQEFLRKLSEIDNNIEKLKNIEDSAISLKKQQDNLKQINSSIETIKINLADVDKNLAEEEKNQITAEKDFEISKKSYDSALNSVNDFAKRMRETLKEGDVCPICGSTVDHILSNQVVEDSVAKLKLALDEKASALTKINNNINSLKTKKSELEAIIFVNSKNYSEKTKEKDESLRKLIIEAKKVNITIDSTLFEQLNKRNTEFESQKNYIDTEKKDFEKKSKELNELLETISNENANIITKKDELNKLNNSSLLFDERKSQLEKSISRSREDLTKKEEVISEKLSEFYPNWKQKIAETIVIIKNDKKTFDNIVESKSNLESIKVKLQEEQKVSKLSLENIAKKFSWKSSNSIKEVENINQKWLELEKNSEFIVKNIENNLRKIEDQNNNLKTFYNSNPEIDKYRLQQLSRLSIDDIDKIRSEVNDIKSNYQNVKGKLQTLNTALSNHENIKPHFEENETLENIITRENDINKQHDEKLKKSGAIKEILKQDTENKIKYASTLQKLEDMRQTRDKWERINIVFGDSNGNKFKIIAQSFILNKLLENANFFLEMLSDRYKLTNPGNNLLILVTDKYTNNSARPVEMVSGGESFIISIALALGLSNMSMQGFSSDFIFIDEGISQLDGVKCDNVINTLKQLHHIIKCNIGIVSHLDKLSEMIPTKIIVQPVTQGTSEVKIIRD